MKRDATIFREMTAGDVVQRTFLVLPQDMRLKRAADLLRLRRMFAAPVAGVYGQCVGVLSVMDILDWQWDARQIGSDAHEATDCVWCDWQMMDATSTRDAVADYMARDPVLITPDTRLAVIAKNLHVPEVRRVVVVDAEQRPIGILSSGDVLAALAAAHHRRSVAGDRSARHDRRLVGGPL